jgi:glycosyltransferase 2 family protein
MCEPTSKQTRVELEGHVNWIRKHRAKLVISLVVAVVFVWLLRAGALPFLPNGDALERFEWWTFAAYIGVWTLVNVLRAWRSKFLLDPIYHVPLPKLLNTSFVGFAAILILPVRAGEFVRPALVREKGKLSGWSVTGTVAAERIIDGLLLSVILLIGLAGSTQLDPLPESIGQLDVSPRMVPSATITALVVFTLGFVVMGVFYYARDWARMTTQRVLGVFSQSLAVWLADRVERVSSGLKFLPQWRYTVPFVFWTTVYWLLNAASTLLLSYGCGLSDLGFAQCCVITGFLALGIMVPNVPGFFGQFQFSVYAALSLFVPESRLLAEGSVLVFALYVGQTIVLLGCAVVGAYLSRTTIRQALAADAAALETEPPL